MKTVYCFFIFERFSKNNFSYCYYIPGDFKGEEKFPVIIFLDPHGNGNFPVEKYKRLEEKFHFILIGSNESKNGMVIEQGMKVAGDLLTEAITTLPGALHQITLAGFSGGAKVALVSACKLPGINSAIYCGAAIPPDRINVTVPTMGIAGNHDMNYTEVRNFNFSIDGKKMPKAIIEWNGKHEWPDTTTFEHAFYWNIFTSIRKKYIPKSDSRNKILVNIKLIR